MVQRIDLQNELTQSNSLANTDENAAEYEDTDLVVWGEALDEGRDNCDEATKAHAHSPAKVISLDSD